MLIAPSAFLIMLNGEGIALRIMTVFFMVRAKSHTIVSEGPLIGTAVKTTLI